MTQLRLSTLLQLERMRDLQRAVNTRHEAELAMDQAYRTAKETASIDYETTKQKLHAQHEQTLRTLEEQFAQDTTATQQTYAEAKQKLNDEFNERKKTLTRTQESDSAAATKEYDESQWEVMTLFDAEKDNPRKHLKALQQKIAQAAVGAKTIERDAKTIMQQRRMAAPGEEQNAGQLAASNALETSEAVPPSLVDADLVQYIAGHIQSAQASLVSLHSYSLPKLYEGFRPIGIALADGLLVALISGLLFGWSNVLALAGGFGVGLVASAVVLFFLRPKAKKQAAALYQATLQKVAETENAERSAMQEARRRSEAEAAAIVAKKNSGIQTAQTKLAEATKRIAETFKSGWEEANAFYPEQLAKLEERFALQMETLQKTHDETRAAEEKLLQAELKKAEAEYQSRLQKAEAEKLASEKQLSETWWAEFSKFEAEQLAVEERCERLFPNWSPEAWSKWQPPTVPPEAIRFGESTLDLAHIRHGLSNDEKLRPKKTVFQLPAVMTFAEHPAVVLTASDAESNAAALSIMQNMMLRFLTAMPPGKVRFTIIDPVGLGDNFSTFMHLADVEELLVTHRIWTESSQITQRLSDITAHMENVLQKYLRNDYESLHEYNVAAGEVAEPFRVLVVANYPANFSDVAARRLASIVSSGARCGVYTLLSLDRSQKIPSDFPLDALTSQAVHLDWQNDQFRWKYGPMEHLPLTLENPPNAERFRQIVDQVGVLAADANRVELPFESLAPTPEKIWSEDCSHELVIPIGRAGATSWQSVRLGRGTSQHVLIAGKTGSGKSTLLHALITSASLRYSPEQVQFYLIDFKKGVEFQSYANPGLPHASIIAIESEREFGLSVLERLDQELRRRGDLFRNLGSQDLAGFRAKEPNTPMPRILLAIDEFQELFVEDDKIAQDSSLLLDRLVRQGRAFGIHVLLGSQTLSGAYSLARSTLGQMAIRIALQCSENDAHLILSEENSAARLLTRPGEAIYNDQNGMVAGNQPFQVVWLSDPKRDAYILDLRERYLNSGKTLTPPIVFEGNMPASLDTNKPLAIAIADRKNPSATAASAALPAKAWLGDAVQIKDPTAAIFRRQGGNHMLLVGQNESLALGIMSSSLLSLAVTSRSTATGSGDSSGTSLAGNAFKMNASFYILDGTRPESPDAGFWKTQAEILPFDITVGGPRDLLSVLERVAQTVRDRAAAEEDSAPAVYLFIHNLGRFRDLRKQEDDFGFSSFSSDKEKPPTADKLFGEIIREGPTWGVHTVTWADTNNSLQRAFDRAALREIEMRVVMQLNAADSSGLIDSPAASRLGTNRALLYLGDDGSIEKFRPYAVPSKAWLKAWAVELA